MLVLVALVGQTFAYYDPDYPQYNKLGPRPCDQPAALASPVIRVSTRTFL